MAAAARRRGTGESRAGGGESAEMKRRGADGCWDWGDLQKKQINRAKGGWLSAKLAYLYP
jgi:hypothetical protein